MSDFGGDGRPCQRRGSQIPPARPWALRCPRALSAHSPGSIRGSRTPPVRPGAYNLAWRSPGGPGGAYNLAWHALSRPPLLFRDSKQNQIHQPARPCNVGGMGSSSLWRVPPRHITPCSSPGCIEAPGGRLSDFGGDGRPCQRRGSQIPPARPWALRCPRAPSAHSPGSIRGSRTPSARSGAYNLAWHALSRPTPFCVI